MVKGVDLAKWNVINDYAAMAADGVQFAVLKAINAQNKPDSRFEEHYKGCMRAGVVIPETYHYTYAKNTKQAKENAKAWIKVCERRFDRFCLDFEEASLPRYQEGVDIINAYADVILSEGYEMDLYTGMSFYNERLKKYEKQLPYSVWIARYYKGYTEMAIAQKPNEKYLPANGNLIGWQYTSSGVVKGAAGRLDLDVWYRDIKDTSGSTEINNSRNPWPEPAQNVSLGASGSDAHWVQWYLYRFGLFLDADGKPDAGQCDGIFGKGTEAAVKEAQRRLGLTGKEVDGVAGIITRTLFKKVC